MKRSRTTVSTSNSGANAAARTLGMAVAGLLVAAACAGDPRPPVLTRTPVSGATDLDPATSTFEAADAGEPDLVLPASILRGLATDEAVLDCREGTQDGVSQFGRAWVGVRRFDLDADGVLDWVVNGLHSCLRDADAGLWWLYEETGDGPRLLLRAVPAGRLEMRPERSAGYFDLAAHFDAGDGEPLEEYRYDGEFYRLVGQSPESREAGAGAPAAPVPQQPSPTDPLPAETTALPATMIGSWEPMSRAYFAFGTLELSADTLTWADCTQEGFRVVETVDGGALLELTAGQDCSPRGGDSLPVVRLRQREPCEMSVTLYPSLLAAASDEPAAWGVYFQPGCTSTR